MLKQLFEKIKRNILRGVIPGNLEKSEEEIDKEMKKRPRSATLLNMKWLAERLRKARLIKRNLENGEYKVDSKKLAKAILNEENNTTVDTIEEDE